MSERVGTAKVTAVVVTYQSADTLGDLLSSARRCHAAGAMECVFVDNDSKDGTLSILEAQRDWAEVILTGKNNGFGRGCNIGLERVKTPYTLFLNPDAQIEPDALEAMVAFMDSHPKVGISGPATLCGYPDGKQNYQATSDLPTPWTILRAAMPLIETNNHHRVIQPGSEPFPTGWICGAVFMIRTDLARQLQGFDPRYFLYWEEMDLCHRAADLGYENWAFGGALANHICGASSEDDDTRIAGCIGKYFYQSRRYYLIKHHGWWAATLTELSEFAILCLRTVVDVVRGKGVSRIRPRLQTPLFSQPAPLAADLATKS